MPDKKGISETGAKLIGQETTRAERRPYLTAFHLFVRNDNNKNDENSPWTQAAIIREFLILWTEAATTDYSYQDFVVDHYRDVTRLRKGTGGGDSPFLFELVRRFLSKHVASMPDVRFMRTLRTMAANLESILEPSKFHRYKSFANAADISICCPVTMTSHENVLGKKIEFLALKNPGRAVACCAAIGFSLDHTEVHVGLYNFATREFWAREPTRPEYYKYVLMKTTGYRRRTHDEVVKSRERPFKGTVTLDIFALANRPGADQAFDFARKYFTYINFDI